MLCTEAFSEEMSLHKLLEGWEKLHYFDFDLSCFDHDSGGEPTYSEVLSSQITQTGENQSIYFVVIIYLMSMGDF